MRNAEQDTNIDNVPELSSATPKLTAFFSLSFICITALLTIVAGCKKDKDKDINFNRALNKKWQTVSQLATPPWTNPATGKTYTDLFDFAKETFPCVVDDYAVYYADGTTKVFHNTLRCYPGEPDATEPGTYTFDNATDSLILVVPFEVPGQPVTTTTFRCKVLELTNNKMVLRYNQIVPFTETLHTITETFKAIP